MAVLRSTQRSVPHKSALSGRVARTFRSFGLLHAANTGLNMLFTLAQLIVLARILAFDRYSEIVFLTSVGLYLQPANQAFGKANYLALRAETSASSAQRGRGEVTAALAGQAVLLLAISLALPVFFAPIASQHWLEDVLFLFLGLVTNYWAFDLQSTAWAIDRRIPFVRLAILHRTSHFVALALAYVTGSLLTFGLVASGATLIALGTAGRIFASGHLFVAKGGESDWRAYRRVFALSLVATLVDLLVLNAPYALITGRFGVGSFLVAFDSVMKLTRIAMAAARTLAEIALARQNALVAAGRLAAARRLVQLVMIACVGATSIAAAAIALRGRDIFHLLLKGNDVVPADAMLPAAAIVLAGALYQSAVFFIGFSGERRALTALTAVGCASMAVFAGALVLCQMTIAGLLWLFATCLMAVALSAGALASRSSTGAQGVVDRSTDVPAAPVAAAAVQSGP